MSSHEMTLHALALGAEKSEQIQLVLQQGGELTEEMLTDLTAALGNTEALGELAEYCRQLTDHCDTAVSAVLQVKEHLEQLAHRFHQ